MKKNKPPISFKIELDIYEVDILVSAGMDYQKFVSLYEKKFGFAKRNWETPDNRTVAQTFKPPESSACAIWYRDREPGGGIMAHESFHAVHHVLDHLRVKLTDDSDEVFAYLLAYIVKQSTIKIHYGK